MFNPQDQAEKELYNSLGIIYKPTPTSKSAMESLPPEVSKRNCKQEFLEVCKKLDIPANEINWDEYKLDSGISISKFPPDSAIIFTYRAGGSDIRCFGFESRPDQVRGIKPGSWGNIRAITRKDDKMVAPDRIPLKQYLEGAIDIWIIPLDETNRVGSLKNIQKSREEARAPQYDRYTPEEFDKKFGYYFSRDLKLDASGYVIDLSEQAKKLEAFKANKFLGRNKEMLKKIYQERVEEFSEMVKTVFDKLKNTWEAGGEASIPYLEYKNQAFFENMVEAKNQLVSIGKTVEYLLTAKEGDNPPDGVDSYIGRFIDIEADINTRISRGITALRDCYEDDSNLYRLRDFYKSYKRLMDHWSKG